MGLITEDKSKDYFDENAVLNRAREYVICDAFNNRIHAEHLLKSEFPKVAERVILKVLERIYEEEM